ncbi:hypothetical protein, partial [Polymorphobacter sp.]|uniref:hypothetical protein n=1 Tax=Polymorphobacter sp. TaxID=1909290 RepID=UPI003F71C462
RSKAMGGFNHVLAMLAETPSGWKLIGWSETPDAAITYLTDLYYQTAAEDFRPEKRASGSRGLGPEPHEPRTVL